MGHSAIDCYNRMNHAYEGRIPPQQLSTMISTSASFSSPNWLTYIGANAHITLDNGNLVHPRDYNGYNTIGGVVGGSGPGNEEYAFHRPSSNGLYLFPGQIFQPSHLFAYVSVRSDARIWHSWVGHPSSIVLNEIISFNKLPFWDLDLYFFVRHFL
ncbi:hypothetical protein WN944_023218 [Citrus x changshan-huyou]|uniref:Uncharacterized protein n=1 Tax=Citrus x changshan-huyou TaxID=2935761 RepID=A0AAP0R3P2_9ROSI